MKTIKLICIVVFLTGLSSCLSTELSGKLSDSEAKNKALKQENMELGVKNTEMGAELDRLKQANSDLTNKNKTLQDRFETYSREMENAENEKSELQKQIDALSSGSSSEIKKILEQLQNTENELTVREDTLMKAREYPFKIFGLTIIEIYMR